MLQRQGLQLIRHRLNGQKGFNRASRNISHRCTQTYTDIIFLAEGDSRTKVQLNPPTDDRKAVFNGVNLFGGAGGVFYVFDEKGKKDKHE